MSKKYYSFGQQPFLEWYAQNKDVTTLVLQGNPTANELEPVEIAIQELTEIDISQLEVGQYIYPSTGNSEDLIDYIDIEADFQPQFSIPSIFKICVNKCYAEIFTIKSGWIISTDGKVLVQVPNDSQIEVPYGIEIIGNCTFMLNESLRAITLPDTLKGIAYDAFAYTEELGRIHLPDSIEELRHNAFYYSGIYSINIPSKLAIIPGECFTYSELSKIDIPPHSVKAIEDEAFHCTLIDEIVLPEGVEEIGYNALDHLQKISFPSTMKEIAKDFYYEELCDDPEDVPFIEVHPNNPYFYSKDGTLYKRGEDEPYLGYAYRPEPETPPFPPLENTEEHTPEEIYDIFGTTRCWPINSTQTRFYLSENGYDNIIDRCLNKYFWNDQVHGPSRINYCFDKYVICDSTVYDIDCRTVIFSHEGLDFYSINNEGYIIANKIITDKHDPDYYKFYKNHFGCIDIHGNILIPFEYSSLTQFDKKGYLLAIKGNKYGYIDCNNNILIPFDYNGCYQKFHQSDLSLGEELAIFLTREKNHSVKYYFIDRNNNIKGIFLDEDILMPKFHIYQLGDKYGYTEQFGRNAVPAIYSSIEMTSDGKLIAYLNDTEFIVIDYPTKQH